MVVSTTTLLFLFVSLLWHVTATATAAEEAIHREDNDATSESTRTTSTVPRMITTHENHHHHHIEVSMNNNYAEKAKSIDDTIGTCRVDAKPTRSSESGPEATFDALFGMDDPPSRTGGLSAEVSMEDDSVIGVKVVAETEADLTGAAALLPVVSPETDTTSTTAVDQATNKPPSLEAAQQQTVASVLETLPMSRGVYHLTSLRHFQLVLDQQQQERQQQQNEERIENHTSLLWVVLLYNTDCAYSPTLLELVQGAAAEQETDDAGELTPIQYYGRILVDDTADRAVLYKVFGIDATPTIALVSADASASFLVEYTGRSSTPTEIRLGAQHYFDTLTLTSQPQSKRATDGSKKEQQHQHLHPLLAVQPRVFEGMEALQTFLIRYARRLFPMSDHYSNRQYHHRPVYPVLSWRASTLAERTYVQWLFSASGSGTEQENDDQTRRQRSYAVLIVQCRYYHHPTEQRAVASQGFYDDFDTMARSLQARRDRLFFVVQQPPPEEKDPNDVVVEQHDICGFDGTVNAYEIPVDERLPQALAEPTERWSEIFTHFQYKTKEVDESLKHSSHADGEQETSNNNDKVAPLSLLVEFIIKVCTDPVLWFDRQTTAPIVFSHFRKVHVVLIVDAAHQTVLAAATDDGHPMAAAARANKRAVTQFRHLCQAYREASAGTVLDRSHMVCLILPSTETRVLTTFGLIDSWSMADGAFVEAAASAGRNDTKEANESVNETKPPSTFVFPSMLITDQRFGGTLRYYKNLNSAEIEIEDALDQFMANYRNEELPVAIKSSTLGARTNDAGVRIVTADTVESELFGKFEAGDRPHSLILFVAPTCGHCKRFVAIWNRLSLLLKHIEWNSFLQLYQMDVSENDVTATSLNVDIEWLPDVYYVAPGSNDLVRYNVTDELGEGIGAIRDTREILEWLIHDLDILSHDQIESVLARL